ncbi:hypothetical protein CC79DRAFT_1107074 [Sarocladium strictum]|jgi:hypothetical protein
MSAQLNHEEIISAATADPSNTPITFPDDHVNQTIANYYTVDEPFTYTHTQLWDMEVKKARNPAKYLRPIIRPGSLKVFDVQTNGDIETFTRVSDQRRFQNPGEFGTVIEQVRIEHKNHKVYFVGIPEVTGPDGEKIVAGKNQPVFHVSHGALGEEDSPRNTWHIVFLTEKRDEGLKETLEGMGKNPFLSVYNEIYIKEDLGRTLTRKEQK